MLINPHKCRGYMPWRGEAAGVFTGFSTSDAGQGESSVASDIPAVPSYTTVGHQKRCRAIIRCLFVHICDCLSL